jgi:hypothetical protein
VRQPDAGFYLVAMLSAGAARHEKFQVAISLQRFSVCRVFNHKLDPKLNP